jgi:hypothetical protein
LQQSHRVGAIHWPFCDFCGENALVNVPRQNLRAIYIAATSDEFDDGISKLAFNCASLNRPVRLYVQNRSHASVFADLIAKPRSIHQRMLKNHGALLHPPQLSST